MKRKWDPVLLLFAFGGMAVALANVFWGYQTLMFLETAHRAPGVVTGLFAGHAHPEIEFALPSGRKIDYGQNGMVYYDVGDKVTVVYDPQDLIHSPNVDTFWGLWGFDLVGCLVGLCVAVVSLTNIFMTKPPIEFVRR